ncbi:hypothetical protein CLTEP_06140 [Clostridium tepidiprofundi DSM 19306]|uniref:DUF2179 domain-containing protein n=1 Tax=Clostridium tepidiprofundi DSM 19306 TaxID=1121338 RepID=A0A151B685_9CLOT|nr:YitT family protein [Clostridium tepidiprofundi]KYH35438.1 hypothetical protein CLTEP_06140 [Clostridium tepidiprofundi DSM 19306]
MENNNIIKRSLLVSLGSLLYAIGINAFIAPHKLLSGGIAGISLLFQYVTSVPSGYWVFILNIPIFIIGVKKVDKDFVLFSILGMLTMSGFLIITRNIVGFLKVDDIVISTIFGAIISGIGMGIIFKNRASQGGTDIIAVIIRNKNGAKMSTLYFVLNGTIVLLGVFVTNLKLTLYTVLLMYIKSLVIDRVIVGFEQKKMIMAITSKEKEISTEIMNKIGRGVTFLDAEGAYTGDKKKILYCIVTLRELTRAKAIIDKIDSKALVSVVDASEVQGNGFLKPAL